MQGLQEVSYVQFREDHWAGERWTQGSRTCVARTSRSMVQDSVGEYVPASVSENHSAELLKSFELTVTLDGSCVSKLVVRERPGCANVRRHCRLTANLLTARSNGEQRLGLDAMCHCVLGDGCGAGHILVRGVGA